MRLRPSDVEWQLLRSVGVLGAEFKFTDVQTRYVDFLKLLSSAHPSDLFCVDMRFDWKQDKVKISDFISSYVKSANKDIVTSFDLLHASIGSVVRSYVGASDAMAFGVIRPQAYHFGGFGFGASPFAGRLK